MCGQRWQMSVIVPKGSQWTPMIAVLSVFWTIAWIVCQEKVPCVKIVLTPLLSSTQRVVAANALKVPLWALWTLPAFSAFWTIAEIVCQEKVPYAKIVLTPLLSSTQRVVAANALKTSLWALSTLPAFSVFWTIAWIVCQEKVRYAKIVLTRVLSST